MNEEDRAPDLKERTKRFALRIIRLYSALPKTTESQVIGKQLLRSGTSVGAHYREAMRGEANELTAILITCAKNAKQKAKAKG